MTGDGEMLGCELPNFNNGGKRLNQFLEEKGISKAEAARRVGKAPSEISNITSGKRQLTVNLSEQLSTALGVSASWLLTGEGPMEVEGWEPPSEAAQHPRPMVTDGQREEAARLRRENAELREEVARLREQTEPLMSVVENLTKRNA